jgi:hypothetical protein
VLSLLFCLKWFKKSYSLASIRDNGGGDDRSVARRIAIVYLPSKVASKQGHVAHLAGDGKRRLVLGGPLRLLGRRILPTPAGHRILKAKTQTGTQLRAHGCRERWRAEDDSERQTGAGYHDGVLVPSATHRAAATAVPEKPSPSRPRERAGHSAHTADVAGVGPLET